MINLEGSVFPKSVIRDNSKASRELSSILSRYGHLIRIEDEDRWPPHPPKKEVLLTTTAQKEEDANKAGPRKR